MRSASISSFPDEIVPAAKYEYERINVFAWPVLSSAQVIVPLKPSLRCPCNPWRLAQRWVLETHFHLRRNRCSSACTETTLNTKFPKPERVRTGKAEHPVAEDSEINAELPGVLFDLDGTLIDSSYQHVCTWWQVLRDAGITIPMWKIHRRIGMSGQSFLRELLREQSHRRYEPELLEKKHDFLFSREIPRLAALPGANELLRHLVKQGTRIAIATTGGRAQTSRLLGRLNVPAETVIVTGDDVEKAKPSPEIFVLAARKLNIHISDCIVVGDSEWDLLAAGRKSALGVGVLSGGYGEEELERAGAFRVYSDTADMLQHLEQLGLPGK